MIRGTYLGPTIGEPVQHFQVTRRVEHLYILRLYITNKYYQGSESLKKLKANKIHIEISV